MIDQIVEKIMELYQSVTSLSEGYVKNQRDIQQLHENQKTFGDEIKHFQEEVVRYAGENNQKRDSVCIVTDSFIQLVQMPTSELAIHMTTNDKITRELACNVMKMRTIIKNEILEELKK